MPELTWRDEGTTDDGICERGFTVHGERDVITGLMWSPPEMAPGSPLVLIGHGGGANKRAPSVLPTAQGFVREHGLTAVCIDAPGHGERGGVQSRTPEYYALWADAEQMTANATADWRCTLDALLASGLFDAERVGWSGMSMGSLIGVPYVATEPRIKAAALGLCGTNGETPGRSNIAEVFARLAPQITVPLIFMMQWSDERFTREGSLELFDLLGSEDKRLVAHLGAHAEMPEEGRQQARAFVGERLKA
ncbi:MAG: alpha/beta hydrolase [Dehalococcoidia bacterium]|nr:alpha/beta hydrolase [Dehalococcoidia bacterium]